MKIVDTSHKKKPSKPIFENMHMMSQNDAKWYKMVQIKKKEVKMRWTKCEKKVKFTIYCLEVFSKIDFYS